MKFFLFFIATCLFSNSQARTIDYKNLKAPLIENGQEVVFITPSNKPKVVVFVSPVCPCSAKHASYIHKLSKEFPAFDFVAVSSDKNVPRENAARVYAGQEWGIKIVDGRDMQIVQAFDALKTPHVFILDPSGNILFEGGVADSVDPQKATKHYLKEALTAMASGKEISDKSPRTLGCYIQR